MSTTRIAPLAVLSAVVLLLFAAMPVSAASHSKVTKEQLTVKISNTGSTVWGTVALSPAQTGGKCKKSTCKYKVAKGTALTLTETPTSASSWPFCGWKVNGKKKGNATTLNVTIPSKSTVVAAVYTLPGQCK